MGYEDDILDAPEESGRDPINGDWALVASLVPEQVNDAIVALEAAGIEDFHFKKEMPSTDGTGIIPLTAEQIGNIKTLVYVRPVQAAQAKALLEVLPEPTLAPERSEVATKTQRTWLIGLGLFILVLVVFLLLQFLNGGSLLLMRYLGPAVGTEAFLRWCLLC